MKLKVVCYWVTTTLIGLETLAGGVTDLAHGRTSLVSGPLVADIIAHLGYPLYLLTIIGVWKVRQVELVMRDGKMMDAQALRASLGISGPPKRVVLRLSSIWRMSEAPLLGFTRAHRP